jgi:hypothetical protein
VDEPAILKGLNKYYKEEQSVNHVGIISCILESSALITINDAERLDVCSNDQGEGTTG